MCKLCACCILVASLTACQSTTTGVDITNRSPWPVRLRVTDIGTGTGITARRPAQTVRPSETFADVFDVTDRGFAERQYMMDVPSESDAGLVVLRATRGRIVRRDLVGAEHRLVDVPARRGASQIFTLALEGLRAQQKHTIASEPDAGND